jgi:hypothetical protein
MPSIIFMATALAGGATGAAILVGGGQPERDAPSGVSLT